MPLTVWKFFFSPRTSGIFSCQPFKSKSHLIIFRFFPDVLFVLPFLVSEKKKTPQKLAIFGPSKACFKWMGVGVPKTNPFGIKHHILGGCWLVFVGVQRQLVATTPSPSAAATLFFRHSELPPNDTHGLRTNAQHLCFFSPVHGFNEISVRESVLDL